MKDRSNVKRCHICTCVLEPYLSPTHTTVQNVSIHGTQVHTPYSTLSKINKNSCTDCEHFMGKSTQYRGFERFKKLSTEKNMYKF